MPHLVFHPIYSQLTLPVKHRFPIEKYQGIYNQLRREAVTEDAFITPEALDPQALNGIFAADYLNNFLNGTLEAKAMR